MEGYNYPVCHTALYHLAVFTDLPYYRIRVASVVATILRERKKHKGTKYDKKKASGGLEKKKKTQVPCCPGKKASEKCVPPQAQNQIVSL